MLLSVQCRKCGKLFNNPNSCGVMFGHYSVCKEKHCNGTGERDEVLADYNNLTKIVESKKNMEADKKKLFLLFSRMFDVNATGNLNMTNEENLKDAATKLSNQIERPHAASDNSFLERCENIKKRAEIKKEDKHTMNSYIEPLEQDNGKSNSNPRADMDDLKMGSILGTCQTNNITETRNLRIQCKLCGLNSNDIFDAMKHERLHDKMKTQEKNRKPDIDVRSKQNKDFTERGENGDVINRHTQNCKPHGNSVQKHKNQKQGSIPPVIQHDRINSSALPTVRSPHYGTGTRNYRSSTEPNFRSRTSTVPQKESNEISKNRVTFDTGTKRTCPTAPNGDSPHSSMQRHPSKQRQATGSFPFRYAAGSNHSSRFQNFRTYPHRVQPMQHKPQEKSSQPLKSILKKSASYPANTLPNESPYLNAPIKRTSSVSDMVYTSQNQSQLDRAEKQTPSGYHKLSPNHLPSEDQFHEFSNGHCRRMKTQNSVENNGVRFRLPSPLKQKNSPYNHKSPDENKVNFFFQEKLPIKTTQPVNNNNNTCQQINRNNLRNTLQKDVRENQKPVQSAAKSNENVRMERKRSSEEGSPYHPQKIRIVAAGISKTSHGFSKKANSDDADRCWPFNANSQSPPPPESQNEYNNIRVNQCNGEPSSPLTRSPNEYIKTNGSRIRSEDRGQKSQTMKPKQCTKILSPTEKPHHHRQSPAWTSSPNPFNTKVNQQIKEKSEMKSPPSLTAQIGKSIKPADRTKLQSPLSIFPVKTSRNPKKFRINPWFRSTEVNASKNLSNQQKSDQTLQNHRTAQGQQSSIMDKGLPASKSPPQKAADREVTVIGQLPQCRTSVSTNPPKSIFDNCPLRSAVIPKPHVNYQALRVQIPNVLEHNLVQKTVEKKTGKRKVDQIEERQDLESRGKVISEKKVIKLAEQKPKEIKEPTKSKDDQSPDQNKKMEKCCSSKDNNKIVHKKLKSKETVVSPKEKRVIKHSNSTDAGILYQHKKFSKLSVQNKFKESQIKVCHTSPVVEKSRSPWDDLCWNSTKEPLNHATTKGTCAAKIQNSKKIEIDICPMEENVINSSSASSESKIDVVRSSSPVDSNETRDEEDSAYTSTTSSDSSPISNIVRSVINSQERPITSSTARTIPNTSIPEYQTNTKVLSETMTPSQPIIRKRRATARKSIRSSIRQQPNAIINKPVDTSNSTCICHVCKKTVPSSQKELYLHWSDGCSKTSDTQLH